MPTVLRLRRGSTASSNAFTGADGEITIDSTKKTIVVHDGTTMGGAPLVTESALTTSLANKVNVSSLSSVATSGSYADLSNKPTLFSGSYTDLTNKPTLFSGSYNDLIDKPSIPSLTGYATESYVNSAVSNLVNAAPAALDTLNELASALGNDASFATTITNSLSSKANTSSLASVATTGSYTDLSNKPTIPTNTNQLTNGSGFITSSAITGKQDTLVSGTSIKTVNSTSLLGSGNIAVQATLVSGTNIKTVNGNSLLGSGNITISGGGTDYSTVNEIKIGASSGASYQGGNAIAIGYNSGNYNQQTASVAIGPSAAQNSQGAYSVAIGPYAGNYMQGSGGIAIGNWAGGSNQGQYAIAIGQQAGENNSYTNSIILNASGVGVNTTSAGAIVISALTTGQSMSASTEGLFIKPIRSGTTTNCLYYDSTTGEIKYGPAPTGGSSGGGAGATRGYALTAVNDLGYNPGTGYYDYQLMTTEASTFAADKSTLANALQNVYMNAQQMMISAYPNESAVAVTSTTYYSLYGASLTNSDGSSVTLSSMNQAYSQPSSNVPLIPPNRIYLTNTLGFSSGGQSQSFSYGPGPTPGVGICTISRGAGFSGYASICNQAVAAFTAITSMGGATVFLAGTDNGSGSGGTIDFTGVTNFQEVGSDLRFEYETAGTFNMGGPPAILQLTGRIT